MATFSVPQLQTLIKIRTSFSFVKRPDYYAKIVQEKAFSNDPDSPKQIMKQFGANVQKAVLDKYDATRSVKNRRNRTGKLRSHISLDGPYMDNYGTVKVFVARDVAKVPYWWLAEYGVKRSFRRQGYMVVGTRSISGTPFASSIPGFAGIGSTVIFTKKEFEQAAASYGKTVKLIPKKKSELARIKNKIYLEFEHPGYKASLFLREGHIYAETHWKQDVQDKLNKMLDDLERKANT